MGLATESGAGSPSIKAMESKVRSDMTVGTLPERVPKVETPRFDAMPQAHRFNKATAENPIICEVSSSHCFVIATPGTFPRRMSIPFCTTQTHRHSISEASVKSRDDRQDRPTASACSSRWHR